MMASRSVFVLMIVVMIGLICAGCGKTGGAANPDFILNFVDQSAEIGGSDGVISAKPGDGFASGSTVRAVKGPVDIGIDAERAVRLLEGSSAVVASRGKSSEREIEFELKTGTLLTQFKSGSHANPVTFRVKTPSGVCGARGTAFFVKQEAAGMTVGVNHGDVWLKGAAGGERSITAGQKAVATLTAPVTDVEALIESERRIFQHLDRMNFNVMLASVRKTVAAVDVKSIQSGLEMFRASNGRYPDRLEEAIDGVRDPWGNPFNYIVAGSGEDYQLSSSGPDGQINTSDDLRLK